MPSSQIIAYLLNYFCIPHYVQDHSLLALLSLLTLGELKGTDQSGELYHLIWSIVLALGVIFVIMFHMRQEKFNQILLVTDTPPALPIPMYATHC